MPSTPKTTFPNSILKKKQTCAKVQTNQAARTPTGRPKEVKESVPENISSTKKDCYDVVDLLGCLEKAKAYLAKSEMILKETPSISKRLKQNCCSELSNVAGTLQNVSRQLLEHFTRPSFSATVEKRNNEKLQLTQEPGLAGSASRDPLERSVSRSESCRLETPKLSQHQQELHLDSTNLKLAPPPSISNTPKYESSLPKARCASTNATKEIPGPKNVELKKWLPNLLTPLCNEKNQGGQDLPPPANQHSVPCSTPARPCSDKLPFTRKQNQVKFSDTSGGSDNVTKAKHKSNEIYLPFIPERVPVHHNELTRAIRLKQDHNMRELFGL